MTAELLTATSGIMIPTRSGAPIDLIELRDRFYSSAIAREMNKQTPRYASRLPAGLLDQIPRLLGNDSLPLEHQIELADIHLRATLAAEVGSIYELDDEAQALLYFTALFHDIGESEHASIQDAGLRVVGDIMSGQKTDRDRRDEANVRSYLFRLFFEDVDDVFLTRVEALIMHAPITGDELLHEIYEAAHELQVSDTMDKARQSLARNSNDGVLRPLLESLITQVTKNNIERLGHCAYLSAVQDRLGLYGIAVVSDADE